MIGKLVDAFFGCRHARYSFPVTIRGVARRPQAAALTGTYVACLDCGKEFGYDWKDMKVGEAVSPVVAGSRPETVVVAHR